MYSFQCFLGFSQVSHPVDVPGKTFSGICLGRYSKHPKSLQTSKLLTPAPLLNLYQYLCWRLVLFNLFKFDLYCFKSLKGMFKKKIGLTLLYLGKQITLNMEGSSFINKAPQSGRLLTFTKVCLSSLSTFFFNDFQFRRITKYLIKRFLKFPQLDTHLCPTCL